MIFISRKYLLAHPQYSESQTRQGNKNERRKRLSSQPTGEIRENHLSYVYFMTMCMCSKLLNIPMQQDPGFCIQLGYAVDSLSKEWVIFFFPQPCRIADADVGTVASFFLT